MRRFKIQNSRFKIFLILIALILNLELGMLNWVYANIYAPADSINLFIATYDTAYYPVLANVDSVQFYCRYKNNTYYDATIISSVMTGIFQKNVRAAKWTDSLGSYGWIAKAFYKGKTGAKTWNWTVKPDTVSANLIPSDSTLLAGIKNKTDKLTFNVQDSLIVDYSNILQTTDTSAIYTLLKSHGWEGIKERLGISHGDRMQFVSKQGTPGATGGSGTSWADAETTLAEAWAHFKGTSDSLTSNKWVFVGPGSWVLSSLFRIDLSHAHIIGVGQPIIEPKDANVNDLFYLDPALGDTIYDVEIAGFTFRQPYDPDNDDGIYTGKANRIKIHDCNFLGPQRRGIWVRRWGCEVYNNFIINSKEAGIYVEGNRHLIHENLIDSVYGTNAPGILMYGNENLVYNNHIKAEKYGIKRGASSKNNLFSNNYIWCRNELPIDTSFAFRDSNFFVSNYGQSLLKGFYTIQDDLDSINALVSSRLAKGDTISPVNYLRTKTLEPEVRVVSTDSLTYVSQIGSITAVDSVRKVYLVDSLQQEVTASTDTTKIKTMNNNNKWGSSYTWNYDSRTLTSGAGSGANQVIIRCKQSSDSANIGGVQIQVLDSVQNSTIGLLTSDSQGRGFFALNNGTYCVRPFKPGWQFTVPETLKVNGNKDTTYYADIFDPGSPPQASLCRVYGWIYDINNQPMVGAKIQAGINTIPLRYENIVISPYYKSTTTDDEGYWYLDLYPNSALNPSDTKYIFFIYNPSGTILRIETTVPNQASWELQW